MNLSDLFQSFFKGTKAQFSPTLKAQAFMDDLHRTFLILKRRIDLRCQEKIIHDLYHAFGGYDSILGQENFEIIGFLVERAILQNSYNLNEIFRRQFIFAVDCYVASHICCFTYKQRIKLQLFIEEYSQVLFPALPSVDKSCDDNSEDHPKGWNDNIYEWLRCQFNQVRKSNYKCVWPLMHAINIINEHGVKDKEKK
ncbi:hypothetical protein [Desulfobacter vibrioformis]|uniref:hypothetical protein n=1 Tax=Desulfobacter vibrioformis TaxID=34031 RepID=UPI000552B2BD|nr:hypothetical protein [Desulfobacter vibrioformis]